MSFKINQNALVILETLENAGFEAYISGGACRDCLLGLEPKDWDITSSASPEQVSSMFLTSKFVGENFGVSLVKINEESFEIAQFRKDGDYSDNRRPDTVEFTRSAKEDVMRRDFTINALLMDRTGKIHDFVGGVKDLENRLLNTVGDPYERFAEDSLRVLRGIRFAAKYNLSLTVSIHEEMEKYASSVTSLSPDRINGELSKILTNGNVDVAFQLMYNTGVLQHILPEIVAMVGVDHNPRFHPEGDVKNHVFLMLSKLPANCSLTLALGVLLHDVAKSTTAVHNPTTGHNQFFGHETVGARMTERILRDFRYSNEVIETVSSHVAQHMKFFNVTKMNTAKLKKFVRQENFNELLELNRLDSICSNGDLTDYNFTRDFLANMSEEELKPVRLLTGNDLKDMGFKPGPLFKTILEELEEAQLNGKVKTREEAVFFVKMTLGGDSFTYLHQLTFLKGTK